MKPILGALFPALAIVVVACGGGANVPPVATVTAAMLSCSWPVLSNANELDIAYPDSNATYWAQPLSLKAGKSISISGSFPGARYFSFTSYNADGSPYSQTPIQPMPWPPSTTAGTSTSVNSEIDDAQLGAQSGVNYFASTSSAPLPPTGTYLLTVTAGPPSITAPANPAVPSSVAVLAAPTPASNSSGVLTGWILYRVYAPYVGAAGTAGEQFIQGGVDLPAISGLPPCRSRIAEPVLTALSVGPINKIVQQAATPAPEPLFQYNNGGSLFPNDDNKYVYATTAWAPGRLIVITGAAPTFPNTDAQAIVQTPAPNVRYWSMCTNKDFTPAPVVLCADDQQTKLFRPSVGSAVPSPVGLPLPGASPTRELAGNVQSEYAFVISATADRPSGLDPDFTWLPWFAPADEPPSPGSQIPGILILRNMLPSPAFIHSVQNIPTYGLSAAQTLLASLDPPQDASLANNPSVQAIAVMGPYYPSAVYCDRTVFSNAYATTKSLGATIAACVLASAGVTDPL